MKIFFNYIFYPVKVVGFIFSWLLHACLWVIIFFMPLTMFVGGGYHLFYHANLDLNGQPIQADVVGWKNNDNNYAIKFEFTPFNKQSAGLGGEEGEVKSKWHSLPIDRWKQSKSTQKINIIYLLEKPWNHAILGEWGKFSYLGLLFVIFIGGVVTLFYFRIAIKQGVGQALMSAFLLIVGWRMIKELLNVKKIQISRARQKQLILAEKLLIKEQYTEALTWLETGGEEEKLKAINQFEEIYHSHDALRAGIVEYFAGYIRTHATYFAAGDSIDDFKPSKVIQQMLLVIGRLHRSNQVEVDLSGAFLLGCTLAGDFSLVNFYAANLDRANCQGSNFSQANFDSASLREAHCENACFREASCYLTAFMKANCAEADFSQSLCVEAHFEEAVCAGASFRNADCEISFFNKANCTNVDFSGTKLSHADFSQADCTNANFTNADCKKAIFTDAMINTAKNLQVNRG